ncbi:MAG: hypothetical protein AB2A00_25545 [Myxococcota bacterium]
MASRNTQVRSRRSNVSRRRPAPAEALQPLPQPVLEEAAARAAELLDEGEQKAVELAHAGRQEVERTLRRVTHNAEELRDNLLREGRRARRRTVDGARRLVRQLRQSRAARTVEALPERVTHGVDVALGSVGLMRLSVHQREMDSLRRKLGGRRTRRAAH